MSFDCGAPAELFLSKRTKGRREKYRRFATAAEAIRYAVEDLRTLRSLGVWMQVGDERFNSNEIHRLYDDADYPLRKPLSDRAQRRDHIGSPLPANLRIDPHRVSSKKRVKDRPL